MREGGGEGDVHALLGGPQGVGPGTGIGGVVNPELGTDDGIIEKTLLSIQEKVNIVMLGEIHVHIFLSQ